MPFSNPFRRGKKDKPISSTDEEPTIPNHYCAEPSPDINGIHQKGKDLSKPPLMFHAQLAHGSPTEKISGFSNVRELYAKIADAFNIPSSEIIFCTLNTHKCDMERLLGGQIGLEDFIFAHVKGEKKHVTMIKTEPALGLTITDNGTGYPFVKRIKENSVVANAETVKVGDHIEAIDQQATIGCRHFQIAKMLKDIPLGATFLMTLIEPKKAFEMISQRNSVKTAVSNNNVGTGKSTLRLRSQGPATLEALPTENEEKAVRRIDDLLDSFLGIRDMELATTIWESGKDKRNPDEFLTSLNEQLADFGFPQDFMFDVWGIILDSRSSNTF